MTLLERISADIKTAMKSGDHARVDALRFALAGLQGAEKDKYAKQPGVPLSDDEAVVVLQKDVKRRKESIELFKKGNRDDLVKKEEADLRIISEYVPKELSTEEIEKVVDGLLAKGSADFNSLMRDAMKELKGRADGRIVGEIIKKKIG
ncbi:MAG: GatB/YqeY domain-containing protein [Minisyncoccia bacterium]|jgi:hypothetical protein